MPNGKNAGRLFPDCTNEHGHGEWHSFEKKPAPGDIVTCTSCQSRFVCGPDGKLARVAWAKSPEFAEVAEALGCPTDHIIATQFTDGFYVALYTPNMPDDLDPLTDDPPIYEAAFSRDADGILVKYGVPKLSGTKWSDIRAQMEEELGG